MHPALAIFLIALAVLFAAVVIFIIAAAARAVWEHAHETELSRLRRFRDDVMSEAIAADEIGVASEIIVRSHRRHVELIDI